MGAFSEFIASKGIKDEEILAVSRRLETLRGKDRELLRLRARKRKSAPQQSYAEAGIEKPRSGRPLRPVDLEAARNDVPLPRKVRSKILRAVNALLSRKGGGEVTARELFGDVPSKPAAKQAS
nr:MAG: hypothetical protein DIU72_06635 [Pseudomonadota bacterium]